MSTSRDCAFVFLTFFFSFYFLSFLVAPTYLPTTHCYHYHYVLTHIRDKAFMVPFRSHLFLSFPRPSFHLFFFYMTGDAICM
jgi:hypothetical protein